MKMHVVIAFALAAAGSAYGADEPKPTANKERPCLVHFTEEGSFFKGKTYKTWQDFTGIDYDKAFRKVAQAIAENNWGTVNANKDVGVITAGQAVTMGEGSVAPLNVIVKEKSGGVLHLEANFSTAGMQKASSETVRIELCKLVEALSE
jgi:hypothetical protein